MFLYIDTRQINNALRHETPFESLSQRLGRQSQQKERPQRNRLAFHLPDCDQQQLRSARAQVCLRATALALERRSVANRWQGESGFDCSRQGNLILNLVIWVRNKIKFKLGNTALHCAANSGLRRCTELLVFNGAPLFLENNEKFTPCDLAMRAGHDDIATFLESRMVFVSAVKKSKVFCF